MENEIKTFDDLPITGEQYNYLDDRLLTAIYQELLPESGKYVSGKSVIEWDEETIDITIQVSTEMTDQRILEIFQGILLDVVNAANHEKEKKNGDSQN